MPNEQSGGYLPGDPRYGLRGEALKDYYRTKPAQWAIYCWDQPGRESARRTLLAEQNRYVKRFGERVIGYGHFVSDDGRDTLGTSFFIQLADRAGADSSSTPPALAAGAPHVSRQQCSSPTTAPTRRTARVAGMTGRTATGSDW